MAPASERPKRGRRKGSRVSIPKSKNRFRRATMECLRFAFDISAASAANGAVAIDEGNFALSPTRAGVTIVVPYDHDGKGILGKANTIRRNRSAYRHRDKLEELEWLDMSSGYLHSWLHAAASGDVSAEALARDQLRQLDEKWPEILTGLIAGLLGAPFKEFQTHNRERLPKRLVSLLKRIVFHRGKDVDAIYRTQIAAAKSRTKRP